MVLISMAPGTWDGYTIFYASDKKCVPGATFIVEPEGYKWNYSGRYLFFLSYVSSGSASFMGLAPQHTIFLSLDDTSGGVVAHGASPSLLCSQHLCESGNMKHGCILTITSLLMVAGVLIMFGDNVIANTDRNVAGFQLRPTLNGEVIDIAKYQDWNSDGCAIWEPYGFLEMDPIDNTPGCLAQAGIGYEAVAGSGYIGTLTLQLDDVGNYIFGATDILAADPDLEPICSDFSEKMILVSDCGGDEPQNNDCAIFRWGNVPTEVCIDEPFQADLYVDIPASLEYCVCEIVREPMCRDATCFGILSHILPSYKYGGVPTSSPYLECDMNGV